MRKNLLLLSLALVMGGMMFQSCEKADVESENEPEAPENGIVYVDLGLPSGTLWATCNCKATSPEGYGDYFSMWDKNLENYVYYASVPTSTEWSELGQYCDVINDSVNGVNGYMVRSRKDPSKYIKKVIFARDVEIGQLPEFWRFLHKIC